MTIITNPEQFASRGDEWGALAPVARDPARVYKSRRHPDGFRETFVVEDEDEWVGPNPHVKPNPFVRKKSKPFGYRDKRRECAQRMKANYDKQSRTVRVS